MARQFSGRRLRAARITAGLKPEQLALRVGRSVYSVHAYERGVQVPSARALAALADALDITVDSLLTDGGSDVVPV